MHVHANWLVDVWDQAFLIQVATFSWNILEMKTF